MAKVTFKFDTAQFNRQLRSGLDDIVREDVQRRARNVRNQASANVTARAEQPTGELASSYRFTTEKTRTGWSARVGSDEDHALWFEEGTGIYGPHKTPIVPRSAKVLVFQGRRGGAVVVARSVRGQPGKHPLRDALEAAAR